MNRDLPSFGLIGRRKTHTQHTTRTAGQTIDGPEAADTGHLEIRGGTWGPTEASSVPMRGSTF